MRIKITLGWSKGFLRTGAQLNSLFGRANGYSMQFDSKDDQLSINRGANYAKHNNFRKLVKPDLNPEPIDPRYGLF